ncbi:hypothetical protein [Gordonia hydrophobica]|uniref:MftR C-terminal domain-containing protein n=1 Tax=Gordonia hydrophobica TaxID=40516 RepID=A0ABZ2U6H4_9ACTN|nr:hypothetical protein [Gordonia hydrophobica]MBM7365347.1 hypothetical protein [Gordonia hydrophobica]
MAEWIVHRAPDVERSVAEAIATVALAVLSACRLMGRFVGAESSRTTDEQLVRQWVEMVAGRIEKL